MFGLFKKKSKKDRLIDQYEKLMKESFDLSRVNRTLSDQKFKQAQLISEQINNY